MAVLGSVLSPAPAVAGEFRVAMCHPGYGNEGHKFTYEVNSATAAPKFGMSVNCAGGGKGIAIDVDGELADQKWARWLTGPPSSKLNIVDWGAGANARSDGGVVARLCYTRDTGPTDCNAPAPGAYDGIGPATGRADGRSLYFQVGCFRDGGCDHTDTAHIWVRNVTLTIADRVRPAINVSGEMLDGGLKAGTQYLTARASDSESGVRGMEVTVNGEIYETRLAAGCLGIPEHAGVYTAYRPCAPVLEETFELDTERAPFVNGPNTVRVCAFDVSSGGLASGNGDCSQDVIEVDNSCPSSAPGGRDLTAGLGSPSTPFAIYVFGDRPRVVGLVERRPTEGVFNALVCVEERPDFPGAGFRTIAHVRTGGTGEFVLPLARGPSRTVRLTYRSGSTVLQRIVWPRMHTRPWLRLSRRRLPNRGCVRLYGAIPGPQHRGRTVALQGRAKGARWVIFDAATTGRRGAFSTRYCFRPVASSATFQFRALVTSQHSYPYLWGASPSRFVRVVAG